MKYLKVDLNIQVPLDNVDENLSNDEILAELHNRVDLENILTDLIHANLKYSVVDD